MVTLPFDLLIISHGLAVLIGAIGVLMYRVWRG